MISQSITNDPPSFDAYQESTVDTGKTSSPAYDRLLQFDDQNDSKMIPDLAERWEWGADGRSVTLFLQKGVTFHGGGSFAARDVKFSLDRLRNPPAGVVSPRKNLLEPVTEVVVVNDSTVKLNLKRPYPALLDLLAGGYMPIYSQQFVEQKGQDAVKKEMMGTGPFVLKEYIRGVSLELAKNKAYWAKDRPYLDGVKVYIIPDAGTTLAAFRSGQLLIGDNISKQQLEPVAREMGDKIRITDPIVGPGTQAISINVARHPFDDIRVRQAISFAVNRASVAKLLDFQVGGAFAPPWSLSQEELSRFAGYGGDPSGDLAKARQLLGEAGFPNGFAATIATRKGVANWNDQAIFAKDSLGKIGITSDISVLDTGPFYDTVDPKTRNFDIVSAGGGVTSADPDALWGEFWACTSPRNWAGYCDPAMEELFLKQSSTLDANTRLTLVHELERMAVGTYSKLVTGYSRSRQLLWNSVKNYYPHRVSQNNMKMLNVWLER